MSDELRAEVERLKAELGLTRHGAESLECSDCGRRMIWLSDSHEACVHCVVKAREAAEAREKSLREALKLSESWMVSLRPTITEFGLAVRMDNALQEIRAALSATPASEATK